MAIPPISITTFGGEVPAVDSRLIADNQASDSVNAWLFSGRIEPVHSLVPLHVMGNPDARSFFRLPIGDPSIDGMHDSYWLEFLNDNVRVIRSPVIGQEDKGRFYWCDGVYPKYMTGQMIANANQTPQVVPYVPWRLGVPAPTVPPGVVVSGGVSAVNKTVTYTYTWVTGNGEEGPPAPPTTVTGKTDAVYTVTVTAPGPSDTDHRNLTRTRIYRTVVSVQGVATFFFVTELPIATLVYADDCAVNTDGVIVNNEQLMSLTWSGPPFDLEGMVTMANGLVAGWRNNEIWFCEPYRPHAWPIQYILAVDAEVVGLGVHNQSLIILTAGQPYAATGVLPDAMTLAKVQPLEPCTSMRSIVNTPTGVLYCSPNGLINITSQGAQNLTRDLILKGQWSALLHLQTVTATLLTNGYYAFSAPEGGVFQDDAFQDFLAGGGTEEGGPTVDQPQAFQMISAFGTLPGAYLSSDTRIAATRLDPSPSEIFNLIQDLFNAETMQLRDGIIYHVDIRRTGPYARYRWKSKVFTLPYLQNLGAAKVYWTPRDVDAPDEPSYFRMFAGEKAELTDDGLPLRFEQEMTEPGQMFRLPSGYKAQYYQFEVEGFLIIDAIHAAQTAKELRHI